jgi:SRSO17 transposase
MLYTARPTQDLAAELPKVQTLESADLNEVVKELAEYHALFAPLFRRREQRGWAGIYLHGLLVADVPRKNIEAIALRLLGADGEADNRVRGLQQFVGVGAWEDDAILAKHRSLVDETLGEEDGVFILDGSDFPKQGGHSVGVARQWSGSLGKKANCQVGVFLGYASRKGYTLLDRRLYLPETWLAEDHRELGEECLIPKGIEFQTKPELAAALLEKAVQGGGIRGRWVVCDEDYGKAPELLDKIATLDRWYLAEVACDTMVWPLFEPQGQRSRARPRTWVPPRKLTGKGRTPSRERLHPDSPEKVRVDDWVSQIPAQRWRRYRILEGSKGPLVADFVAFRALAVRDGLPGPEVWVLIRRKVSGAGDGPEWKFYLSNAPVEIPLGELVRVSGMRWPIESCFTEGKGHLGMDHYELRFWPGWHHHMTLVILAHHFLVRLQRRLSQIEGDHEAVSRAPGGSADDIFDHPSGQAAGLEGLGAGDRDSAELGPSMHVTPGGIAPTRVQWASRIGFAPLPAASQGSVLSFASHQEAATLG